ncbi:sulfiredoxin isoform X1 [Carex rostrata]
MATLSLHFSPPIRTRSFPTIVACSNGVSMSKPRSNGGPVVMEIPLEKIRRPLMRVRSNDPEKVNELMDSIRVIGLQVPIDVLEVDGVYYGFSGCHRYEAHQQLGLPTIRCKVRRGTKETLRTSKKGTKSSGFDFRRRRRNFNYLKMSSWPDFAVSKIREFAGFTVSKAGESFVENVVGTAYSRLCDRMRSADTEAEIKKLQTALPQITAVIGIAEALKIKDPSTSLLADQFKQAAEASQNVLNELEKEAGGSASTSKKRKSCHTHINNDTLKKLKVAVAMSDRATDDIELLLRRATMQGIHGHSESQILCQESTSFLTEREVFGREVEKKKIIDWLKRPTEACLSSFGIVGMGGLGKTTLLQFVYQQIIKENNFEKTIWVWVSNNFSVEQVTRKMIDFGDHTSSCGKSLNALQESLKEMIISKKVLLILDNVGDDNRKGDWEKIFAPLRFVEGKGSKILFTTRMRCVADLLASVINTEYESLELQGLEEQDLGRLFYSYAFHGFNRDNHRDLEEFANPKLRLLRGSPLAAKVIGNLLNSNMDNQHWRKILNHESLVNLEKADDIVKALNNFKTQIRR